IEQCLKLARLQYLTVLNEGHAVAGALDLAEQVRVEQHGGAALALGLDDLAHEPPAAGVEARSRLVQEDELGVAQERLRESDALQHALREMAQLLVAVWSEADQVQELRHARAQSCSGHSVEPAMQPEKLGGREPVVKAEVLGQEADLAAGLDVP